MTGTDFIQVTGNAIGFNKSGQPTLPNSGQPIVVNGSTNDTITNNQIACFAAGTRIATDHGEVAVEALSIGDRVRTVPGDRCEPVVWTGHRHIDCRRHPEPRRVRPVRISAGAFGPGLPRRDLLLSPDHAVFVDGVLIPVKHLINRRTIRQIAVHAVSYFHVELRRHAVLLAEGLPAESYLDTGNRSELRQWRHVTRLFADFGSHAQDVASIREANACAPFVVHGAELDVVRRRLAGEITGALRLRRSSR